MAKKRDYKLNEAELAEVESTIRKGKTGEVVRRATALRLLHHGHPPSEVAEMMGVAVASIYNWRSRWLKEGVAGLQNRPKSGRPTKTDEHYWAVVEQTLNTPPSDYGYSFTIWTTERLSQHVARETGIELNSEYLRVLLLAHGYVYRRPKADLTIQQDADAYANAAQIINELKKRPKQVILSYSLWMKVP